MRESSSSGQFGVVVVAVCEIHRVLKTGLELREGSSPLEKALSLLAVELFGETEYLFGLSFTYQFD